MPDPNRDALYLLPHPEADRSLQRIGSRSSDDSLVLTTKSRIRCVKTSARGRRRRRRAHTVLVMHFLTRPNGEQMGVENKGKRHFRRKSGDFPHRPSCRKLRRGSSARNPHFGCLCDRNVTPIVLRHRAQNRNAPFLHRLRNRRRETLSSPCAGLLSCF